MCSPRTWRTIAFAMRASDTPSRALNEPLQRLFFILVNHTVRIAYNQLSKRRLSTTGQYRG